MAKLNFTLQGSPNIGEAAAKADGHFSEPNLYGYGNRGKILLPVDPADDAKYINRTTDSDPSSSVTNRCFNFDGGGDYLTRNFPNTSLSDEWTFAAVVKLDDLDPGSTSGRNRFFHRDGGTFIRIEDGVGWVTTIFGSSQTVWSTTPAIDTEYAFVWVKTGGDTATLYVNGSQVGQLTGVTEDSLTSALYIGNHDNTNLGINGQMRNIYIDPEVAWSAAEITAYMAQSADKITNQANLPEPAHRYTGDYGSSAVVLDSGSSSSKVNLAGSFNWTTVADFGFSEFYLLGGSGEGPYLDLDLANPGKDTSGADADYIGNGYQRTLDYSGRVPRDLVMTGSPCLSGDGTQYVSTGLDFVGNNQSIMSVTARIKVQNGGTGFNTICSEYNTSGNDRGWLMAINNGKLYVLLSGTGASSSLKIYESTELLNDGNEHIVGFTWNSGTLLLYIDGVEITPTLTSDISFTSIHDSAKDFTIGCHFVSNAANSALNYVSIFDIRLSSSLQVYTSQSPVDTTPEEGHFPLSEGNGDSVWDVVNKSEHSITNAGSNWNETQDSFHYSELNGFTKYTHASETPIEVPRNSDGTYNTTSQAGFTKAADLDGGGKQSSYTKVGRAELGSPDLQNYSTPGDTGSNAKTLVDGDDLDLVPQIDETHTKADLILEQT